MKTIFGVLSNRSIGDRRGQVAIFIALIFQVLFLFFAMVVNVGLLVHHKINLQNSVDIAAYYGAMKQAEVLNATAHINYQIRQSYKLLTWRYRVLGTSGVWHKTSRYPYEIHPVQKNKTEGVRGAAIVGNDSENNDWNPALEDYYQRPAFCLAFRPFAEIPANENTCQDPMGQTIPALREPPIIAGFIGAAHTALKVTQISNRAQQLRCRYSGPYNYVALARFLVAFNIDQGNRKLLIYKLANGLSQTTDDFLDLEGERASDGIWKNLENNLTAANFAGLKRENVKIYNGLGHSECGESKDSSTAKPPKWLSEIVIFPRSSYKMCTYQDGSNFEPRNIDESPDGIISASDIDPDLMPSISYLKQYVTPPATGNGSHFRSSLGVEKNPWCMAYVGVRAETEPDIPFSLGKIKLRAVAFAKPFGGRIGPWYGKTWPRSAEESQGIGESNRTDPRTPIRCPLGNMAGCTVQGQDAVTTVNYSRFPSDPLGLASRRVHGQYGKSIYDMGTPSFNMWEGIEQEPKDRGNEWDILAWDTAGENGKMRRLEISAVVPDLFDLTYYSIDPDFYKNYYEGRIEEYLKKNPISAGGSSYTARMDHGSRKGGLVGFNIKKQIEVTGGLMDASPDGYGIDYRSKLLYLLADSGGSRSSYFGRVLTSWVPPREILDYEFKPDERFGKCQVPANDNAPIPGSCEKGGRTGYSVKLISSDYLLDVHELGGSGGATDHIKNPPPADFYEFR